MRFLAKLEKNKIAWVLIGLCLVFFFLRLPSLIEPYWYGDEGIYEVIGQSMNHGELLYRDIWDNKPPLLYIIYSIAGGDQTAAKTFSLIVGLLTIVAFYFLSEKLFNKQKLSIGLTALFVLLFATPVLEANIANAEDFILLPIILGGLLIYKFAAKQKNASHYSLVTRPLLPGLLLGIAFLLKIVAIFDFAAFLIFYIIVNLPKNTSWSIFKSKFIYELRRKNKQVWSLPLIHNFLFIILGFLIPFFVTVIYFALNNGLKDFIQAAFFGNIGYVGWENNLFGIPQGWLVLKTLLLLAGLFTIFKAKKRLNAPEMFILLWLMFALYNVYFSGRPYTHYAIVLLPSFCLFVGLFFASKLLRNKIGIAAAVIIIVSAIHYQFQFNITYSFSYYQNAIQFLSGQKTVVAYQTYFDRKVPRDYAVANFISTHTKPSDSVFVWGNNPQIYALAHKIPIGKYTVAYHIQQNNAFNETQTAINKKNPKYIIVLSETEPLPFVIPLYIMRYNITGATIYERSL